MLRQLCFELWLGGGACARVSTCGIRFGDYNFLGREQREGQGDRGREREKDVIAACPDVGQRATEWWRNLRAVCAEYHRRSQTLLQRPIGSCHSVSNFFISVLNIW